MEFVEGCDGAQYISSKPDWLEALKVSFEGKTPMGLFAAMTSGKPRVPWVHPTPALLAVLLRGLSVEPSERYPSMPAVIEVLAEIHSPMPTLTMSFAPTRGLHADLGNGRARAASGW